jgi:hypothetical protein
MAALALDDDDARAWLEEHQREDGSFGIASGRFADVASTPLAALALPVGSARESALDHVEDSRGRNTGFIPAIPLDHTIPGWGWNDGTASWTEPTARALWALRLLRPGSPRIQDAVDLLRDREAVAGGWNYGNREVLGSTLPPNALTTAISLIALRGSDAEVEARGVDALRRIWSIDTPGPLTLAVSVVAFDLLGAAGEASASRRALGRLIDGGPLDIDAVAFAWAALATERPEAAFP